MNILFISQYKYPHIGGVERHIEAISHKLYALGYKITTISEEDIKPPRIKYLGLLYIWFWLFKNLELIKTSDIVHIHDVFIWYLPFKFLFPKKKVYTTFHGWEGKYPIPYKNILQKKIANKLSNGTIAVGKYIEKYYFIKTNCIIYGGIDKKEIKKYKKTPKTIVYLGRLEKDTGLLNFLSWFSSLVYGYKVIFVGDGKLRKKCERYGKVIGNVNNPKKYLRKAKYCVPSGYLSYWEAKNMKCKILTFADNPLKKDYWKEIKKIKTIPVWKDILKVYIKLWSVPMY